MQKPASDLSVWRASSGALRSSLVDGEAEVNARILLDSWLRASYKYSRTIEKHPSRDECFSMVSHVDITWNSFLPYLIKLNDQLEDLGFRYVDNKVIVSKEDIDEKGYNKSFKTDLDEFYKEFTKADSEQSK